MSLKSQSSNSVLRVFRFLVTGVLNTLLSLALFSSMLGLGFNYLLASLLAYLLAMLFSYFVNKVWVFQSASKRRGREMFAFFFVNIMSLSIGLSVIFVAVSLLGFKPVLGQLVSVVVTAVTNFLLYSRVFRISK